MSEPRTDDSRTLLPPAEPLCLVEPDGAYHPDRAAPLELSDDDLRELYALMAITRRVDREAINLQRQGQLGVYASCMGQEAAQVGAAWALQERDWIFPSYREMGAAIVRGVDPAAILHLFRGTWLSDHDPYEHRFGLLAIPIGTQALHAAGMAMGARLDDEPTVTLCCLGDGATSEGDPHEAMNFAAVFEAPCVFFVQNNQYAISVPLERQTHAPTLAHKAVGYGMPGYRCDGNDVLGTLATVRAAVERARRGEGPAMVEAVTYRMEAHTTSDDPTRYRSDEELEQAALTDPIQRMANLLRARSLLDDDLEAAVVERGKAAATRLRDEIYEAPHGDPMELFAHVYRDPAGHFEHDRRLLADELAAEADEDEPEEAP